MKSWFLETRLVFILSCLTALCPLCLGSGEYLYREDDIRLIRNIGAKFIGRALYRWGGESRLNEPGFWAGAEAIVQRVHAFDPDVIFQGCLFEAIKRIWTQ